MCTSDSIKTNCPSFPTQFQQAHLRSNGVFHVEHLREIANAVCDLNHRGSTLNNACGAWEDYQSTRVRAACAKLKVLHVEHSAHLAGGP